MDANSPKPSESGFQAIAALNVLRIWLDQVGGNNRPAQVLALLAEDTANYLGAGHASPALDADTLRKYYYEKFGGRIPETPASRWLPSADVRRWWDARRSPLEHACRQAELAVVPVLTLQTGGGRGNTTLYRLDFEPLPVGDEGAEAPSSIEAGAADTGIIRYQVEPAKAAWWLHPIIGEKPFRMRSLRGYLLIGIVVVEALTILAAWGFLFLALRGARPLQAVDIGLLLSLLALTWTWCHFMQPIIRLPIDRVTIANELFLAWSQLNGQFRLTRDAQSKRLGGWFQFVRHSGTCPLCAGEVEIASGGRAFPDRLVGRCSDSPLEHVFSFDPVSLAGQSLRTHHQSID